MLAKLKQCYQQALVLHVFQHTLRGSTRLLAIIAVSTAASN